MESDDPNEKVVPFSPRRDAPAKGADIDAIADRLRSTLTSGIAEGGPIAEDPDWQALLDEKIFAKRFGFDACRSYRERVISLKNDADLTDREIRTLRRSGNLALRDGEVRINVSRIEPIMGWIFIGVIGVLMLLGVLSAVSTKHPSWLQVGVVTALESLFLVLWWGVMEIYIRPPQIGRRAMHTLSTHQNSD